MKTQLDSLGISAFCESMAMMMRSGIHMEDAVELLTKTGGGKRKNGPLEQGLEQIKHSLMEGDSLNQAMEKTGIFPGYVLRMVRSGEKSGKLEDVLFRLSQYYADQKEITEQIRAAVLYPAAMILLIIAVLIIMLKMVLPAFKDVYNDLTGSLASSGYGYIRWSYAFCWIGLVIMLVLLGFMILAAILWKSGKREPVVSAMRLIPLCREILNEMGLYRFTSAFMLFLSCGYVQDEAATESLPITGCKPVEEVLSQVIERMDEGNSFAQAAGEEELFEPVYSRMLLAGERTGNLEEVLLHLSELLRESCAHRIERFLSFLDPMLSGILVLTIGVSLMSIMLPLIGIMNAVG